jgi:catechol 2,3-dioxygenase
VTFTLHPHTELGLVSLKVSQLQRSLQFYQQVIGLRILEETKATASLTADGVNPLLFLEEIPHAVVLPERSTTGLYHFALLLPSRKDLGMTLRHLVQENVNVGQADHLVSEALYLSDVDGNGIEIYRDRPRSEWRRDARGDYVMATDPLDWEGLLQEAGSTSWTGMPAGTKMGHIHLHVKDLESTREFYHHLLGFEIVGDYRPMRALFLAAGGYHHHIGTNIWAGLGAPAPGANATGLAYFTVVLPTEMNHEEYFQRLESHGIPVSVKADGHYVTDPSRNTIRFV